MGAPSQISACRRQKFSEVNSRDILQKQSIKRSREQGVQVVDMKGLSKVLTVLTTAQWVLGVGHMKFDAL